MVKPSGCNTCPFLKYSTGFCPDSAPERPRIAVVLKMPGKEDVLNGAPMSGKAGQFWWHEFFEPFGLERSDVLITSVIRCFPNTAEFPIGAQRKASVQACRGWDEGIIKFSPNVFGVSWNPADLRASPQLGKFLRRAIKRAVRYADEGYRPCLLLGNEARDKYAPNLEGQTKVWNGHWTEGRL